MAVPGDGTIRETMTDHILAFMEFAELSSMESLGGSNLAASDQIIKNMFTVK